LFKFYHVLLDGEIKEFPVIPIKEDDIIDTNGAGDAFVGGLLLIDPVCCKFVGGFMDSLCYPKKECRKGLQGHLFVSSSSYLSFEVYLSWLVNESMNQSCNQSINQSINYSINQPNQSFK